MDPTYPRRSSQFTLSLGGGKRALLVRADNSFTKEGEYWSAQTKRPLPEGVDYRQKPEIEGSSHFMDVDTLSGLLTVDTDGLKLPSI